MEQALALQTDTVEDKDINMILEHLQMNGINSFFDHPECPFSSLQEVDQALRELEREFLKLSVGKEPKILEPAKKPKASLPSSPSSTSFGKLKLQKKNMGLAKESRLKLAPRADNKTVFFKKTDKRENSRFPSASTSRISTVGVDSSKSDVKKTEALVASEDSTAVCGVDSGGKKYRLKIEVFATVKLEPEDSDEGQLGTKVLTNKTVSKFKGMKKENMTTFSSIKSNGSSGLSIGEYKSFLGEDKEGFVPLILNYRSTICKPCPSFVYQSASDLRKSMVSPSGKVDEPTKSVLAEAQQSSDSRGGDRTLARPGKLNEVPRSQEKTSLEENKRKTKLSTQESVISKTESNLKLGKDFGRNLVVNYSVMKERTKSAPLITDNKAACREQVLSESVKTTLNIQLGDPGNVDTQTPRAADTPVGAADPGPCKNGMLSKEQQTSLEMFPVFSSLAEHNKEDRCREMIPPKPKMVDKQIATSDFSFTDVFPRNIPSPDEGVTMKAPSCECNRTTNTEEFIGSDRSSSNLISRNNGNNDYSLEVVKTNCSDDGCNPKTGVNNLSDNSIQDITLGAEEHRTSLLSAEISLESRSTSGSDDSKKSISYGSDLQQKTEKRVSFDLDDELDGRFAKNDCVEAEESNNFYSKWDDVDLTESSSNETVIMVDNDSQDKLNLEVGAETGSNDEFPVNTAVSPDRTITLIDKGVGLSGERLNFKSSTLVDKKEGTSPQDFTNDEGSKADSTRGESVEGKSQSSVSSFDLVEVEKEIQASERLIVACDEILKTLDEEDVNTSDEFFTVRSSISDKEDSGSSNKSEFMEASAHSESESLQEWSEDPGRERKLVTSSSKVMVVAKRNTENNSTRVEDGDLESRSDTNADDSLGTQKIGNKFQNQDLTLSESESVLKVANERTCAKKSEESLGVQLASSSEKIDQQTNSGRSALGARLQNDNKSQKGSAMSEHESKFVKGVFTRHTSGLKNKIAVKRRAFSNLDQESLGNKMGKAKKPNVPFKTNKKLSLERSVSHDVVKTSKQPSIDLSPPKDC